ncbi:MAG: rhomboid family intramembrane serine protease [Gammaproteobacteria bacterium]|nr:rhomboid family intramembrane serine protease [Gammaproteobacteria bacterium]
MPPLSRIVGVLLALNIGIYVGIFVLARMIDLNGVTEYFALWPVAVEGSRMARPGYAGPGFWLWQLVTYGFLHGSNLHLLVNMFALWMFGSQIERLWGSTHFLFYYFFCLVGAGVAQVLVTTMETAGGGAVYPTIGASGAVFGLLLAFGMMFPNVKLVLLFFPVPIKAKYFVVLYGLLELTLGVTGTQSGVAHFAHLGGMFFGLLLIQFWRGKLPWKPKYILYR